MSDEGQFVLQIDPKIFRQTNEIWNKLSLNHPWSVGYVTSLIEAETFLKKEDWEEYYYKSGEERKLKRANLKDQKIRMALGNHLYIKENPKAKIDYETKNINLQHGRTENDLLIKSIALREACLKNKLNITLEEAYQCVRYRVIGETWNGIIVRERNTIKTLTEKYPNLTFVKTEGDFDYEYAVDYEVKKDDKLLFGVQIKPKSYTYNLPYVQAARRMNMAKNLKYLDQFGVKCFDVISSASGDIANPVVFEKFQDHI